MGRVWSHASTCLLLRTHIGSYIGLRSPLVIVARVIISIGSYIGLRSPFVIVGRVIVGRVIVSRVIVGRVIIGRVIIGRLRRTLQAQRG
jgi:hypothetical protein